MRAPTCLLALLLPLAGCEPMEDPGSPFAPVHVTSTAAPGAASEAPAPALDPLFPTEDPIVIHSSEMGKAAAKAPSAAPEAPAPAVGTPAVGTPAPALAPVPEAAPVVATYAPVALGAWPLRLVATVPGAQPPRAILGLPGGGEVVVTPGTMLPEANVVVMAVGAASVDLAEVRAVGDHAVVQARTLLSLQGAP